MRTSVVELATEVVEKQMDEFSKKHYEKISKKLEIDDETLKEVIQEILKLNPRPGNSMADGQKSHQQVIADFMMVNEDGQLILTLNSRNSPVQPQTTRNSSVSNKIDASDFSPIRTAIPLSVISFGVQIVAE